MALALTRKQLAQRYEPPADYGFFGPDSVTWKVWSYPTSFILGFVRSVTIEHLDPNLAAAVIQSGGVKYRPNTRYTRTLRYFGMVMFGATEPTAELRACRMGEVITGEHSLGQQGFDQGEAGQGAIAHGHGRGAVERHYRRRIRAQEHVVPGHDPVPVGVAARARLGVNCRDGGLNGEDTHD